jgi:hypothetical protein
VADRLLALLLSSAFDGHGFEALTRVTVGTKNDAAKSLPLPQIILVLLFRLTKINNSEERGVVQNSEARTSPRIFKAKIDQSDFWGG